jgi:hypothetical protein
MNLSCIQQVIFIKKKIGFLNLIQYSSDFGMFLTFKMISKVFFDDSKMFLNQIDEKTGIRAKTALSSFQLLISKF